MPGTDTHIAEKEAKRLLNRFILIKADAHGNYITKELARRCAIETVDEKKKMLFDSDRSENKFLGKVKERLEKM